jgi:hypothetical protein
MKTLKKALSVAFILGWAGAALSADASGQGSGSLPPTTPPAQAAPACSDIGCGDGWLGCLNGDNCGDDCVPGSGVSVGATWHIIRPVISNNQAAIATTLTFTGTRTSSVVEHNFDYKFSSDPSIWVGYRSCDGLGFSVTWFHMDNSANGLGISLAQAAPTSGAVTIISTPAAQTELGMNVLRSFSFTSGAGPVTFNAGNDIKMDIWDFDVTQKSQICCLDLTWGGGIRYFHIAQDYNSTATESSIIGVVGVGIIPFTVTDNFNASSNFNGGGPTIVLNGLRHFGCSGFGLYGNARGGVLFGDKHDNAFEHFVSTTTFIPSSNASVTSDSESTIGFLEIELGAQWGGRMGSVNPFVRLGFEGREYWGVGTALSAFGSNTNNVGAYGVALSAGVGW